MNLLTYICKILYSCLKIIITLLLTAFRNTWVICILSINPKAPTRVYDQYSPTILELFSIQEESEAFNNSNLTIRSWDLLISICLDASVQSSSLSHRKVSCQRVDCCRVLSAQGDDFNTCCLETTALPPVGRLETPVNKLLVAVIKVIVSSVITSAFVSVSRLRTGDGASA